MKKDLRIKNELFDDPAYSLNFLICKICKISFQKS